MGRRCLVTGGAGFIGSNLVRALYANGHDVIVVDNLSTGSIRNVRGFMQQPRFEFMCANLCNKEVAEKACQGVDWVFHQAALGSVPRSVKDPLGTNDNNVRSTLNVLEAARAANVKRLVYASSASVYGDEERTVRGTFGSMETSQAVDVPTDYRTETMLTAPANPYAVSKLAGEEYVKVYHRLHGLETIALRYFNVFGERQNPAGEYAAVVPKFVGAAMRSEPMRIEGDGEQFRDFTHVSNVVLANLLAAEADSRACGRAYNVGAGGRTTVNALAEMIRAAVPGAPEPVHVEPRLGDVRGSIADTAAAGEMLEYAPLTHVEQGVERTVRWYMDQRS